MKLISLVLLLFTTSLFANGTIEKNVNILKRTLLTDRRDDSYHRFSNDCSIVRYDVKNREIVNDDIIFLSMAGSITEIVTNIEDAYFDVKLEHKRAARRDYTGSNTRLLDSYRFYVQYYETNLDDFGTPYSCDAECMDFQKDNIYTSINALRTLIRLCNTEG